MFAMINKGTWGPLNQSADFPDISLFGKGSKGLQQVLPNFSVLGRLPKLCKEKADGRERKNKC